MNLLQEIYTAFWIFVSLAVLILVIHRRASFAHANAGYWRFLIQKWKIASFLVASIGITVMGPFTHDPTWDFVTAPMMSFLTFMTSPWSVGAIFRVFKRKAPFHYIAVAGVAWMLSASWLYDIYLYLRDGMYPSTWLANMAASSLLYCSAGLLWNLDWRKNRGVTFAFLEKQWFHVSTEGTFQKLGWFAFVFFLLGALMLVPYLF